MTGKKIFSLVSDSRNVFIIKVLLSVEFLKGKYISELLKRAQKVVDGSTLGFQITLELCEFESALFRARGPRSSCTAVKIFVLKIQQYLVKNIKKIIFVWIYTNNFYN